MDYLSKKKQYVFLNNQLSLVRVHVFQISSSPNIWVEGKSKKYRDSVQLLKNALSTFDQHELPPIIIVANQKIGNHDISSYNHDDDVIYFNSYYHTQEKIYNVINDYTFAAQNLSDIIQHELAHKLHWDAVKRFYKANKNRYNNISEAKKQFDSNLESYIVRQENSYLMLNVSPYADKSFRFAKEHNRLNIVNEVIAEVKTKKVITDPKLSKLVEGELNYGRN